MRTNISNWSRIALGAFLILYAINQFFHFVPMSYSEMPDEAENFLDSVVTYLPLLYIFEIIIGLFLIFNKWTSFILIVLFPLSVSFLIFTYANSDLGETWPAFFVAALNCFLLFNGREKYKLLFD
jgi:putative oxidoreductase